MMRTVALRGLAIVISIALLWWLVADARWQGVGARLARIDATALIGVALLFAASYAMRGARIHGEFRDELATEARTSNTYLRILRLTLVHNALVNVLPFRSGEVAFPVLLGRWFGIGTARAVVSLLWLRAQDAAVVMALAALVWPGLSVMWRLLALVVIVGGAIAVPMWARRHATSRSTSDPSSKLGKLRALLERSTRKNTAGWLWTIGNWSVKLIAEAWLIFLALGPAPESDGHASTSSAALGAIGAELAAIFPVQGVAGFGTFEAGAAALMRTQDVALQTGLEAALVLHAVVLALALIAGGLAAVLLPGPPVKRSIDG
jgi:uncharacterized membrane protein YbhN (UPF0104 family)